MGAGLRGFRRLLRLRAVTVSGLGCPGPHLPPNHASGLQDQGQSGNVPGKKPVLPEGELGSKQQWKERSGLRGGHAPGQGRAGWLTGTGSL